MRSTLQEALDGLLDRASGCVYIITHAKSGKSYVGQTTGRVSARIRGHLKRAKYPVGRALRKHGIKAFCISIEAYAQTKSELDRLERSLIQQRGTRLPNGYNCTDGGEGIVGYRHTDETRRTIREKRASQVFSAETRALWSRHPLV